MDFSSMVYKVIKVEREVNTGKFGSVIQLVSLPNKRIGLLNKEGELMVYDLYHVLIDKFNLKAKVFRVHALNQEQIIILNADSMCAQVLNLKDGNRYHLAEIPSKKQGDNYKDLEIFFKTRVEVFRESGHVCLFEHLKHQTNLIAIHNGEVTPKRTSMHNKNAVIQKFDQCSKLVMYSQDIVKKKWDFKIVDIADGFCETEYQLNMDLIPQIDAFALVTMVKQISDSQIVLFLNSTDPGLFIYNLDLQSFQEVEFQAPGCLEELIVFDKKAGFLIVSYLGKDSQNRKAIDIIQIHGMKSVGRLYQETQHLIAGWQNNYFINQKSSDQLSLQKFWLRHIIKKSSLYMFLMRQTAVMDGYGSQLCRRVIGILG